MVLMLKTAARKSGRLNRRGFFRVAAVSSVAVSVSPRGLAAAAEAFVTMPFENGKRPLVKYPQKRPLIRLTTRPPQLETPFAVFDEGVITPNDAFFVRYPLADIPLRIDPDTFQIAVKGKVTSPLNLSLKDLKTSFEPVEIVAVNQCSGT